MPVHEDAMHAVRFIKDSVAAKKPFFINLWVHEPHTPFHTVPKYEWRFRDVKSEADRIYASVLSHADDRIGDVLNTLDEMGLTDNTLVIFSSDNGPARSKGASELSLQYDTATGAGWGIAAAKGITGGRRGYKASLFEGGIGVPFIVRWPGQVAAGKTDSVSLISAVDLLPTFCEVAGVKLPSGYAPDGVSVVDVLRGKKMPQRKTPLFWRTDAGWSEQRGAQGEHWVGWAVVQDEWKMLMNKPMTYLELYRISDDVAESKNWADEKPEVVKQLKASLTAWQATLPAKPTGDVFSELRKIPGGGARKK